MFRKAFSLLKSEGLGGFLKTVYYQVLPHRIKYFSKYKPDFESRLGLEIGGPSRIFRQWGLIPVYSLAARIDNCNFDSQTIWEGDVNEGETFIFNKKKAPGKQYISEASELKAIEDLSYDFILSSHCIEHLANPLKGLSEWIRVLKQDGVLVLVVPHKDGTFDHRRPVTSLDHLIEDFNRQIDESDRTHLEEILRLHDLNRDPGAGDFSSFEQRSRLNVENRCLHHHVFDTSLVVEIVNCMGLQILAVEAFHPYHIIIAKKVSLNRPVNNEYYRAVNKHPCWSSPFPSDHVNINP